MTPIHFEATMGPVIMMIMMTGIVKSAVFFMTCLVKNQPYAPKGGSVD
jgi:hypothetical protein